MNKTITKIKKCKNKVVVYFAKEKLDLSFSTFSSFYLYEGKEVNPKEFKAIELSNQTTALFNYAFNLRKKANYSEWKLREKLYAKEANKEQVDAVIDRLKKAKLIDDESYANDLCEYLDSKNYGQNKIISYLQDKGIFEAEISKLEFPYDKELAKAKKVFPILVSRYSKYNYEQKKAHIYNALLVRGFSSGIANNVMNNLENKNPKEELDKLKKDYAKAKDRLSKKYKGKELNDKIVSSLMMKGYKFQDIMKVRN